jgi:hypothetical protein
MGHSYSVLPYVLTNPFYFFQEMPKRISFQVSVYHWKKQGKNDKIRGVRRGVSKGVEDGRTLSAGYTGVGHGGP